MKKLTDRQWGDVCPDIISRHCTFCGEQHLSHEPRYAEFGGIDVIALTCDKCGHVEIFDFAELERKANKIDRQYRERHMR